MLMLLVCVCVCLCAVDFMIQQPNLEVLNPTTLDDFLDKMEPMEGGHLVHVLCVHVHVTFSDVLQYTCVQSFTSSTCRIL